MPFDSYSTLAVLSFTLIFIYQVTIFKYVSTVFNNPKKNDMFYYLFSLLNVALFIAYSQLDLPPYLLYISVFAILTIEFKFIADTDIVQLLCGASIIALNMASITLPTISIYAIINNISPLQAISSENESSFIIYTISTVLLFIILKLVSIIIPAKSISRITTKSKYSILLLVCVVSVVLYQSLHTGLMITDETYVAQVTIVLATSFSAISSFYFVFLYSIKLIDANSYKRYSDNALKEFEKINHLKNELAQKVERDSLTGTYNRKFVMETLESMCSSDFVSDFSLLFIDINALKYVNDKYGHDSGDKLIIKISKAILDSVREVDIVARIGGDEFVVVITDQIDSNFQNVVDRISKNIDIQDKTEEFIISASIGGVYVDKEMQKLGLKQIIAQADEDMRAIKEQFYKSGRGKSL